MPPPPPPPLPPPIPLSGAPPKKDLTKTPQELVTEFWDRFFARKPGKVTSIFPRALYATLLPDSQPRGLSTEARNAAESYEAAARECRDRVRRIVRECARTNEKFTDPDFDIETDPLNNCLNGLVRDNGDDDDDDLFAAAVDPATATPRLDSTLDARVRTRDPGPEPRRRESAVMRFPPRGGVGSGEYYSPGSVHRLDWVFESPQFTVDGFSSSDIKQGGNGDCWWLAAVATIAHRRDLMARVCVARDEECGVYGFVFQRDGEWVCTIVDDNLYLRSEDFDFYSDTYDSTGRRAREHRRKYQTGSEALYFAKCADPNETWLPLLEKAYAKVHGDYEAISGGWSGEGVEDMTGGVATTIATNRVLRKDALWRELVNSDGDFVFALSAIGTGWDWKKGGLALGHAYSILKATEEVDEDGNKVRLVQIRNPWGERMYNGVGEWNGPWSDGSKEWTPYWLKKLNHRFGDDGIFWMSYGDMLDTFRFLHRTRLFGDKWTVVQRWTSVNVGWVTGYLNTKFLIEIKKAGKVVIVLTQLDERYFKGLEGQYDFQLHFLLQEPSSAPGEHICRVRPVHPWESRSVSCEVELSPGVYEVVPKITASRSDGGCGGHRRPVEDVVREHAAGNPQKLRQVGLQYDLAHAKGGVPDEDELLVARREREKAKREAKRRRQRAREKRERRRGRRGGKLRLVVETRGGKSDGEAGKGEVKDGKDDAGKKKSDDEDGAPAAKSEGKVEKKDGAEAKPEGEKGAKRVSETKSREEDAAKEASKEAPKEAPKEALKDGSANESASSSEGAPTPSTEAPGETPAEEKKDPVANDEEEEEKEKEGEEAEGEKEEEESGSESESSEDESEDERDKLPPLDDDRTTPPWNAVCVVGLRVYANDPDVTITLVKPKDAEEAASLAVDTTPAGATM